MLTRCAVKVVRSFMALFYDFPSRTSLVTIARRVRNARYITNVAPVRRAICFIVCLSLILSSQPVVPAGVGRSAEKPNVHLTQGPPSSNLPNLNEARVISNFPNMPYRDSGGMLAESAVKIANPRNDTNGGSASKDSRKEYGYRSRRLPVAAQSGDIVTVNPGAYQTPANPGDLAVTLPSTAGHGSTYTSSSAHANGGFGYASDGDGRSARWSAFQSVSGVIISVRLKFNWSVSGSASAGAADDGGSASSSCDFNIDYSLDGGSSWINRVSRSRSAVGNDAQSLDDSGSEDILLSVGQNITQVQVRDSMLTYADASGGESLRSNSGADITTSISLIRVEVELDTTAPVISNVAAGGVTTTGATITWTTNENSDSQVEYGTDQTYGQSTTLNPALVTAHSQGLSGLTAGTPYYYRVKSRDAAGNLAVSGDFTFTATPPDTTPPTVTSRSPAAGATNVILGANVTVTFSEAMNPATVNGSSVELRDPSNALVPATVSYNADSFTATLALSAPLSQGVTYTARVRGGGTDPRVKDVAGNALAADVTWTFTTRSYTNLSLNMALIDPNNSIGSPGEDLLSRNCNWSLPLLALPGRAGLDLGLALSLNSLVYTSAGSVMYFDPYQEGYPAPGRVPADQHKRLRGRGFLVHAPDSRSGELGIHPLHDRRDSVQIRGRHRFGQLQMRADQGSQWELHHDRLRQPGGDQDRHRPSRPGDQFQLRRFQPPRLDHAELGRADAHLGDLHLRDADDPDQFPRTDAERDGERGAEVRADEGGTGRRLGLQLRIQHLLSGQDDQALRAQQLQPGQFPRRLPPTRLHDLRAARQRQQLPNGLPAHHIAHRLGLQLELWCDVHLRRRPRPRLGPGDVPGRDDLQRVLRHSGLAAGIDHADRKLVRRREEEVDHSPVDARQHRGRISAQSACD